MVSVSASDWTIAEETFVPSQAHEEQTRLAVSLAMILARSHDDLFML